MSESKRGKKIHRKKMLAGFLAGIFILSTIAGGVGVLVAMFQ